jgi:Domain of unknown function (DUF4145)
MHCPHCTVAFHDSPSSSVIGKDKDAGWITQHQVCPECKRIIIALAAGAPECDHTGVFWGISGIRKRFLVYPRSSQRKPLTEHVPAHVAEDFNEACLVISDSAKAAAALARRCLQSVLRDAANVKKGDLSTESLARYAVR